MSPDLLAEARALRDEARDLRSAVRDLREMMQVPTPHVPQ